MSLKGIQLTPLLLKELFTNNTIVCDDPILPTTENKSQRFLHTHDDDWYIGDNRRHVMIVMSDPTAPHLSNPLRSFLLTILSACTLTLSDVAIVNDVNYHDHYTVAEQKLKPVVTLFFGASNLQQQWAIDLTLYDIMQKNGCSFLLAPSLQFLQHKTEDATLAKAKLWTALKQLFSL